LIWALQNSLEPGRESLGLLDAHANWGSQKECLEKARELFYGAERINAERCKELGIVNRVVPDDLLDEEAFAWARKLAEGPTVAYRLMKQNLDRALRADLPTCLAGEAAGLVESARTEDHREAVLALIEKRQPKFAGR
jgi:enoyl-CoA hydratase/carnithine racemase